MDSKVYRQVVKVQRKIRIMTWDEGNHGRRGQRCKGTLGAYLMWLVRGSGGRVACDSDVMGFLAIPSDRDGTYGRQ
jgi:hypothetical protein